MLEHMTFPSRQIKNLLNFAAKYKYVRSAKQLEAIEWLHSEAFKLAPGIVYETAHIYRNEPLEWMSHDISFIEIFDNYRKVYHAKLALEHLEKQLPTGTITEFYKMFTDSDDSGEGSQNDRDWEGEVGL